MFGAALFGHAAFVRRVQGWNDPTKIDHAESVHPRTFAEWSTGVAISARWRRQEGNGVPGSRISMRESIDTLDIWSLIVTDV